MRNPLTIEAFADWCESKPADEEYDYADSWGCACAQYAKHLGMGNNEGGFPAWRAAYYNGSIFWERVDDEAVAWPWTFGALATRLRANLAA